MVVHNLNCTMKHTLSNIFYILPILIMGRKKKSEDVVEETTVSEGTPMFYVESTPNRRLSLENWQQVRFDEDGFARLPLDVAEELVKRADYSFKDPKEVAKYKQDKLNLKIAEQKAEQKRREKEIARKEKENANATKEAEAKGSKDAETLKKDNEENKLKTKSNTSNEVVTE